ncbi:MAG: cytochrome ubiquinol oxidase subunit I [Candidatus Hydrogenedens sp.]|nr:cytochrome ubiquinol oxidase subunit I [Candidatus Hydrogenedens sp.]
MELEVEVLARVQFALTVMFHYLFPPLSIGLGWLMVVLEGQRLRTGDPVYERAARFWTKIFAVNFALGVATGIVMEFQFGTNWAIYSRFVGDVFGSALAAEGIFAFFLESGFLAILVFGWDRVSPRMHFFATCMVALGATFSAVWIVVANSWQQTPAGYHLVEHAGMMRAEITDFWAMVFNPSSMHRLNHVFIGSMLTGAFAMTSISAWYLLQGKHKDVARRCMPVGLFAGLIFSLLAPVSGHFQAETVAETQPQKLAAFEGHFRQTEGEGAPLWLFGWPDTEAETVRYGLAVPGGLSFLIHGDFNAPVPALADFPPEDLPPVVTPFVTYHLMVAVGMAMLGLSAVGVFFWWRGSLEQQRWLLGLLIPAVLLPYIGNQAGWIAAEVGRQPWIVWGMLRTGDALSPSVTSGQVLGSILMFGFVYLLLFALYVYILNDKIQHGPDAAEPAHAGHAGFLDTAAAFADPAGPSMTSSRSGNVGSDGGA